MTQTPTIRRYRESDRPTLGEICVATGDAGADATGLYVDDNLLPMLYAYPYVDYAPDMCWVIEQEDQVTGYILGVSDVVDYARWYETNWLPKMLDAYPSAEGLDEKSRRIRERGLNPQNMVAPYREQYPAEFHIDLLPVAQRRGLGSKLVETFVQELRQRDVNGLAIGVSSRNPGAVKFYERVGFEVLAQSAIDEETVGYTLKLDI